MFIDDYVLAHDRYGDRYLFASEHEWRWSLEKDPQFRHFKPVSAYAGVRVLRDLADRDNDLLGRIHQLCFGDSSSGRRAGDNPSPKHSWWMRPKRSLS